MNREQLIARCQKVIKHLENCTGSAEQESLECFRIALASLEAVPAYWITYYPDTDEEAYREHSHSGPESCARRIAGEIGGYVTPVYHGVPGYNEMTKDVAKLLLIAEKAATDADECAHSEFNNKSMQHTSNINEWKRQYYGGKSDG